MLKSRTVWAKQNGRPVASTRPKVGRRLGIWSGDGRPVRLQVSERAAEAGEGGRGRGGRPIAGCWTTRVPLGLTSRSDFIM